MLSHRLVHRERALPGQAMTRGDAGAVLSYKKIIKEEKMGFCLLLRCCTNSLLQDDMDASSSCRSMDEYGGLLNRGKQSPRSLPRTEAAPALPCPQHLPPPRDGPHSLHPLSLSQNRSCP